MKINLKDLEAEVIKLAAERPDFIYQSGGTCSYVGTTKGEAGGEGCIVGQALVRMGVQKEALRKWENRHDDTAIDYMLASRDCPFTLDYDGRTPAFIKTVQSGQDRQLRWSAAVATATSSV